MRFNGQDRGLVATNEPIHFGIHAKTIGSEQPEQLPQGTFLDGILDQPSINKVTAKALDYLQFGFSNIPGEKPYKVNPQSECNHPCIVASIINP